MSSRRQGGAGGGRLTSRDAIEQLYQLETGHSREEIKQILKDCGGDVHEASNQLFVSE